MKNSGIRPIIVLDDDPTGTQTVHDIDVYTDWSAESIAAGFKTPVFFVLTNSRSFSAERTIEVHREIARTILAQGRDFIVVSRGDSTLRGHYPIETAAMAEVFAENNLPIDGEIIVPFFPEGGRITQGDIHYVRQGDDLTPAAETEFARDKTFGYKSSDLKDWVEEKTAGAYKASDVLSVSLDLVEAEDPDKITKITDILCQCKDFRKVIVNATEYGHLRVFAKAFREAEARGKRFIFRSAAAMVKVLADVSDQPLLSPAQLQDPGNTNGGLVIVGSHVAKTTAQVEALLADGKMEFIELNQHLALDPPAFAKEAQRVLDLTAANISAGKDTLVMTRRERFDLGGSQEDELALAVTIGDQLVSIANRLPVRPSFVIAKGGITSSDVATKGLKIKKARVAGQILPGVPVWQAGPESKFPGLMLVIFPGNVGDENALLMAVNKFVSI